MSFVEFWFGFNDDTKRKFPWLFTTNPVDRHTCTRKVPMQVLSLGMGRTGTASMQAALQILGYPTYHGFDIHANKPDNDMWIEAFDAKFQRTPQARAEGSWGSKQWREFFDKLLGHVSAVTDLPCNAFGPELMDAYPEAKVILVEREIEAWYKSWETALIKGLDTPGIDFIAWLDRDLRRMLAVARGGVMNYQFKATNTKEYRENSRPTYRAHYALVREHLKNQPGRLLEYKLGSGWEPLCGFLGKEVPDAPFPHVNESATHDEMGDVVKIMMIWDVVRFFWWRVVPVLVLLGAVYWQFAVRGR